MLQGACLCSDREPSSPEASAGLSLPCHGRETPVSTECASSRRAARRAERTPFSENFQSGFPLFLLDASRLGSLRYRLPQVETIESRPEPTTVLVGKFSLDVAPEYYCAPELDTTVWLRGIASNSGQWTLLSGDASVFFGEDFLGESRLKTVQPGEEFTLHLGAASAVSVERTQLEDKLEGPGWLGSTSTLERSWNVRASNNGAAVCASDGSISLDLKMGGAVWG